MYMNWDRSMEVGHPTIDADHQALINHLNALVDTLFNDDAAGGHVRERTAGMLDTLHGLIERLFGAETALMERCGFPNADEHAAQHQELLDQFVLFMEHFTAGTGESLAHFIRFLREWFDYHAETWDQPLAAWLRAGPRSDPLLPQAPQSRGGDLHACHRPAGGGGHDLRRPPGDLPPRSMPYSRL